MQPLWEVSPLQMHCTLIIHPSFLVQAHVKLSLLLLRISLKDALKRW